MKIPEFIKPMLATLVDEPFDNEDWLFEVKWDGFRALAFITDGKVSLKSRNDLSFNNKFPSIVKALEKVRKSIILDGEVVGLDAKGKSQFQLIQNYLRINKDSTLCYYVFDILFKDGEDLRDLPLIERKEILKKFLEKLSQPSIRYSDHILKDGKRFFKVVLKEKLEGIIGKKIDSTYQSRRSRDWVKIKTEERQEVVICGFTEPKGSRKKFGALIAGLYDEDKHLHYAGHVGGGFDAALLQEVYAKLQPLISNRCPFKKVPKVNAPVTWVKPKLIAEVSFAGWTKNNIILETTIQDGVNLLSSIAVSRIMRQPIFQGLRMDKNTKSVKQEVPTAAPKTGTVKKYKDLSLTNLEKVYWPDEGYTKGDLIAYYEEIAKYILPYLKDRPIMLHRVPNGIKGKDFYQKNINFSHPDWIHTCAVKHEGKTDNYLMIDDVRSLLYAVNLGSIDLHPFLARINSIDHPDFCVIDLDPHDISFDKVIEAALTVHEILDGAKVKHYCKTSGGKGLHILIPLGAKYDFNQSKQFAEIICSLVNKRLPKTTSVERSPEKRPKKIYLDFLQNRFGQTIVAPYAVRPRAKAMVSTPLEWDEINDDLDISAYTIETVPKRVKKIGDILKPILGPGINLKAVLSKLEDT